MTAVLEAVAVCKSFSGVVVLHNLEMQIHDGALFGLVGANGAGKTTALDVIGGQAMADSGSVRIAGLDIGNLAAWQRAAAGVGRTFQESRLWSDLTVEDHFRVARNAARKRQCDTSGARDIGEMCAAVELSKTMLDRMPSQLRLLDRRRVELAMAAQNASDLLLVDEIGAGLDVEETRALYGLISELIEQRRVRAAVLVEHKLELLAAFATELALIADGRIQRRADCKKSAQVADLMNGMFARKRVGTMSDQ